MGNPGALYCVYNANSVGDQTEEKKLLYKVVLLMFFVHQMYSRS